MVKKENKQFIGSHKKCGMIPLLPWLDPETNSTANAQSFFFHFSGISSGVGFLLRSLSNPVRKMISLSQQLKAQIEDASH